MVFIVTTTLQHVSTAEASGKGGGSVALSLSIEKACAGTFWGLGGGGYT